MLSYKYVFKYIVIGDSGVGKSCLLMQFTDKRFGQRDPTIGVEFACKMITVDSTNIKLQVWDTAGQEAYGSITRSYYKAAAGALIVYDITRRKTFENVRKWLNEVREGGSSALQMLLVGNKTDLESIREVSFSEGEALAREFKIGFMETSAKTAQNVDDAFMRTAEKIYNGIVSGEIDIQSQRSGVRLGENSKEDGKENAKNADKKSCSC
mmetsp:Transcript_28685/g.33124  ORF Transcript_28685/g.33124 Transcript_28685/m.33124 type:complete len:210 (-) Transcript_28685:42-671(-)